MAHQDSITDKELEKLLEIAERPKEKKQVIQKDTDVERYIKKFEIKEGDTFVAGYIIYYHYWKSKQRDRMSRVAFFRRFAKYFNSIYKQRAKGYMLDPEPYDLTTEGYFKARALLRREKYERQKEKNK